MLFLSKTLALNSTLNALFQRKGMGSVE